MADIVSHFRLPLRSIAVSLAVFELDRPEKVLGDAVMRSPFFASILSGCIAVLLGHDQVRRTLW
jgi:hypothetical protein